MYYMFCLVPETFIENKKSERNNPWFWKTWKLGDHFPVRENHRILPKILKKKVWELKVFPPDFKLNFTC